MADRPYNQNEEVEKAEKAYAYRAEKLHTAAQEQSWDDCSIEQKIERMRSIVRNLREENLSLRHDLHSLQRRFNNHEHVGERILFPHTDYYGDEVSACAIPKAHRPDDKVWF